MPLLSRYEELTGRYFHVSYDDDDPGRLLGETQTDSAGAEQTPKDGLMGAGYIEMVLTERLR